MHLKTVKRGPLSDYKSAGKGAQFFRLRLEQLLSAFKSTVSLALCICTGSPALFPNDSDPVKPGPESVRFDYSGLRPVLDAAAHLLSRRGCCSGLLQPSMISDCPDCRHLREGRAALGHRCQV